MNILGGWLYASPDSSASLDLLYTEKDNYNVEVIPTHCKKMWKLERIQVEACRQMQYKKFILFGKRSILPDHMKLYSNLIFLKKNYHATSSYSSIETSSLIRVCQKGDFYAESLLMSFPNIDFYSIHQYAIL